MKKDIHPDNYRPVLFIDSSSGAEFIIGSTVETAEKAKAKIENGVLTLTLPKEESEKARLISIN